jgi:hypothetical protein
VGTKRVIRIGAETLIDGYPPATERACYDWGRGSRLFTRRGLARELVRVFFGVEHCSDDFADALGWSFLIRLEPEGFDVDHSVLEEEIDLVQAITGRRLFLGAEFTAAQLLSR